MRNQLLCKNSLSSHSSSSLVSVLYGHLLSCSPIRPSSRDHQDERVRSVVLSYSLIRLMVQLPILTNSTESQRVDTSKIVTVVLRSSTRYGSESMRVDERYVEQGECSSAILMREVVYLSRDEHHRVPLSLYEILSTHEISYRQMQVLVPSGSRRMSRYSVSIRVLWSSSQ